MAWNQLTDLDAIPQIAEASAQRPQLIFKHSTRCPISTGALYRMEGSLDELETKFDVHFLDLIAYRAISNEIASYFDVTHQSPQVIVVHKGKAVYDASHHSVSPAVLMETSA